MTLYARFRAEGRLYVSCRMMILLPSDSLSLFLLLMINFIHTHVDTISAIHIDTFRPSHPPHLHTHIHIQTINPNDEEEAE